MGETRAHSIFSVYFQQYFNSEEINPVTWKGLKETTKALRKTELNKNIVVGTLRHIPLELLGYVRRDTRNYPES